MPTLTLGPAPLDLSGVRAGDRNLISVVLLVDGNPLDITGTTVTSQVRKTPVDPVALDAEVTVVDAVDGQLTVRWPGDDIRTLLAGQPQWVGVWDLQVQWPGEDPITMVAGRFTASMDVTRVGTTTLDTRDTLDTRTGPGIATVRTL